MANLGTKSGACAPCLFDSYFEKFNWSLGLGKKLEGLMQVTSTRDDYQFSADFSELISNVSDFI